MLFIDSNMYLQFFKGSSTTLKKLMPSIESTKSEIFVTQQVVDEVARSKLRVASKTFASYKDVYKDFSVRLPEHLEKNSDNSVKDWHSNSAKLRSEFKKSQESLVLIIEKLLSNIAIGQDSASVSLEKVFERAKAPTNNELEKARIRKELGSPPGKPSDPLGDQVSWEQLLSAYSGDTPLWIISADDDYSSKLGNTRFLNPFLYCELRKKLGFAPKVFVFDTLADGIRHFSEHGGKSVEGLPSDADLQEIASRERVGQKTFLNYQNFPNPIACFHCGEKMGFSGPIPRPSSYGGWTYQWLCNACQDWIDFGEPYDE